MTTRYYFLSFYKPILYFIYQTFINMTYTSSSTDDKVLEMKSESIIMYQNRKESSSDEKLVGNRSDTNNYSRSICKNEHLNNEETYDKQKPKLLEQLELFLKKELFLLGVNSEDCNEISLQAHRETFEYLIDNFKTYKHILSCIKNSYEMTLRSLTEELHDSSILKKMVVTTADKYEMKIMGIYQQKKQEIIVIEEGNRNLEKEVNVLLEEESNVKYIMKRLKQEIRDISDQYGAETQRHKLLVAEINNLYAQIFTSKQLQKNNQLENENEEEEGDPASLKNAVNEARERENIASQKFTTLGADYSDVIPKKDFGVIKKKYDKEIVNHEDLMNTFKMFKSEYDILLKMNQSLIEERDNYYSQLNSLNSIAAAIAHWYKCIDYITGGDVSWQEVSTEEPCVQLVELLTQTINAKEATTFEMDIISFGSKGLSEDIPKFLRCEGEVRNRRMIQRDCIYMIEDIWANRTYEDDCSFMDFLDGYMNKLFPDDQLRLQWMYTLHYAVKQLSTINNYIDLFFKILYEEIDESVYHCQDAFSKSLMESCYQDDDSERKCIDKETFQKRLEEFLKGTKPEVISSLVEKAVLESDEIDLQKLLSMTRNGEMSPFLTSIREWLKSAWKSFIDNLSIPHETKFAYPDDIITWFQKSDMSMEPFTALKLQCWCFSLNADQLPTATALSLETVLIKLHKVGLVYKQPQ